MRFALERRAHVGVAYAVLLAVVLIVAATAVGPAVTARRHFYDELATNRASYARFNATIDAARAATAEIETRSETVDRSAFFTADTSVLAAADLQSKLRALIDERRGTVSSMSIVPAPEDGLFPAVAVTATLQCSIDCLTDLLYAIETGSPALFVDELSVQSMHQLGRVLPTRDIELDVRLTVRGYRYVAAGTHEERS